MIKLFKNIDEKLAEIGFTKVEEDKYGCFYERKDKEYGYTQKIAILRKKSGRHILQSYDPKLFDDEGIGNTCVGLTGYEMKLFLKKNEKDGIVFKRRKEMIKLEVEEYCDDCPEFDAHVEKVVLFAGYSKKYCNTNITCEHKDKCKRLKDMIEKETKKRND